MQISFAMESPIASNKRSRCASTASPALRQNWMGRRRRYGGADGDPHDADPSNQQAEKEHGQREHIQCHTNLVIMNRTGRLAVIDSRRLILLVPSTIVATLSHQSTAPPLRKMPVRSRQKERTSLRLRSVMSRFPVCRSGPGSADVFARVDVAQVDAHGL
jgi:hypothetical protein